MTAAILTVLAVILVLLVFAWLAAGSGQGGCARDDDGIGGRADD